MCKQLADYLGQNEERFSNTFPNVSVGILILVIGCALRQYHVECACCTFFCSQNQSWWFEAWLEFDCISSMVFFNPTIRRSTHSSVDKLCTSRIDVDNDLTVFLFPNTQLNINANHDQSQEPDANLLRVQNFAVWGDTRPAQSEQKFLIFCRRSQQKIRIFFFCSLKKIFLRIRGPNFAFLAGTLAGAGQGQTESVVWLLPNFGVRIVRSCNNTFIAYSTAAHKILFKWCVHDFNCSRTQQGWHVLFYGCVNISNSS